MTTVVEKVCKLIALAGSASTEEARTAAATACKLIREHGLLVVEKTAPAPRPSAPRPGPVYARADDLWGSVLGVDWASVTPCSTRLPHDTFCSECNVRISAGEPLRISPVKGARHVDCDAAARKARGEGK
jgi:hypothetical protein